MRCLSVFSLIFAVASAWIFWWPVLGFFLSLIPPTAEYAWVGKILVYVGVAYFGGIVVPLICLICAVWFWLERIE